MGFTTVELVLLVPVFVLVLLLLVAAGRVTQAQLQVTGAAGDGARAASLTRTPAAAQAAAHAAVQVALSGQQVTCTGGPDVTVDVTGFVPGGTAQVRVDCHTRLADLGLAVVPGSTTVTAQAASPVEMYRSRP